MPKPSLLYAQVVKSYRRWRIVGVKHRVIFGSVETIESILAKRGWKINTAFIERLHLDFRQHVAAIGRRVNSLCKHEAGLRQQLAVFQAYHKFCLPHASFRLPRPEVEMIAAAGSIKRWRQQTLAMAAGLTDRVWRLRDVLDRLGEAPILYPHGTSTRPSGVNPDSRRRPEHWYRAFPAQMTSS